MRGSWSYKDEMIQDQKVTKPCGGPAGPHGPTAARAAAESLRQEKQRSEAAVIANAMTIEESGRKAKGRDRRSQLITTILSADAKN